MALLHDMSDICTLSELDLFSVKLTQTQIERSTYHEISTINSITENGPLEFFISASSEEYLDLNNSYIHIQAKITKADGTNLDADTHVGFTNYPGATLFSQLDITLADTLVTHSSSTYPYRAMLECLLNYGEDALKTQFACGLFCKDTAGHMDVTNPAGHNEGYTERVSYTEESKIVDIIAPIHADMFFQEKMLINGVDIKMKFIRAKDEFCLMSANAADGHKVKIMAASIYVKKVAVDPGVRLAHAKALAHSTLKYPIDRTCLKTVSIPGGTRVCTQENLYLGQIPKFIVIGFVDNEAFSGSYGRNPFKFHHYHLEYIALHADGHTYPGKPLQPAYNNEQYGREYHQMMQATGRHLKDRGLAITRKDFGRGYTLYCFNLDADEGCGGHVSLIRSGNVRLETRFRVPLQRTVTMLCYAVFDSVIEISSRRQVLIDYH